MPAACRILTPRVPLDEGEKGIQEKPDNFDSNNHRPWSTILLPSRYLDLMQFYRVTVHCKRNAIVFIVSIIIFSCRVAQGHAGESA